MGDKEGNGTLEIAVVMISVTDASVPFVPGSLEEFTSSRVVLYCTLRNKRTKKQMKEEFFKHLRLNHRNMFFFFS